MSLKIIQFHGQQYFVDESYFDKRYNSIITVSHESKVVLRAQADIRLTLGDFNVEPLDLEYRDQLSRRLSTLPVKDKHEDAFTKFETCRNSVRGITGITGISGVASDDDDCVPPEFVDSEAIRLPLSDDCSVNVGLLTLAQFNWLTIDITPKQVVRLHKVKPNCDDVRWENFREQIMVGKLKGKFQGETNKAFFLEDLIEKAKKCVIVEQEASETFFYDVSAIILTTITQRYGYKPVHKKLTAQDIFNTFDTIQPNPWIVYGIMKAVIDGLHQDDVLPEIDRVKGSYTSITWQPDANKADDVSLSFEKREGEVEITFSLNGMFVKFNLF
jgi:hypothetical protein|nr:MAG TPA: hypothetical protein [Caudoviricetes sp.]